ncbi:VOC family protein [Flavobacterium caeni]|uniref:Glyoxalase-like domain-containing protein n=1 Tax=Flavobacterium caeni TaxID=490189 RepID=A0A1G5HVF4_9FLAO|nr:hypothetical protein [Flavobacterium caeni]SCY67825.1 hypothetical protein SAMN02927903_02029 [Flavobacterium caeni]
MKPSFRSGPNIAIKVPKSKFDATIAFYRDILQLDVVEKPIDNPTISRTCEIKFGPNTLWLDCVDNYSRSEIWLELQTPDVESATQYLFQNGVDASDELEKIPNTMHWIQDPAGTVLLLGPEKE